MTLFERINELIAAYGGVKALGSALSLDTDHLARLAEGAAEPSREVLRKLGLRRIVTVNYEKVEAQDD